MQVSLKTSVAQISRAAQKIWIAQNLGELQPPSPQLVRLWYSLSSLHLTLVWRISVRELPVLKQQKTRLVSSLQVSANLTDSILPLTIVTAPWFYGYPTWPANPSDWLGLKLACGSFWLVREDSFACIKIFELFVLPKQFSFIKFHFQYLNKASNIELTRHQPLFRTSITDVTRKSKRAFSKYNMWKPAKVTTKKWTSENQETLKTTIINIPLSK